MFSYCCCCLITAFVDDNKLILILSYLSFRVLLFINAPNISVCDDVICDFADDVSGLLFSSRYISTRFCLNFLFCVLTGAAYRHDIS